MNKKDPVRQYELSQLMNSSENPIKDSQFSEGFKNPIIKDVTDKIDTKSVQKIGKTSDVFDKVAAFRAAKQAAKTGGKKLLGTIPVLGGIASAALSQDASAAIPLLDSAESLGPQTGTFDDRVAKGTLTDEDKLQLMEEQARIKALRGL